MSASSRSPDTASRRGRHDLRCAPRRRDPCLRADPQRARGPCTRDTRGRCPPRRGRGHGDRGRHRAVTRRRLPRGRRRREVPRRAHLDVSVVTWAAGAGIPMLPGAATPTEVLTAWRAGAAAVKVFPASSLGPSFIRELRGPLPDILLLPTGGISVETAASYIEAGAIGIGMGSWLSPIGRRRRSSIARVAPSKRSPPRDRDRLPRPQASCGLGPRPDDSGRGPPPRRSRPERRRSRRRPCPIVSTRPRCGRAGGLRW